MIRLNTNPLNETAYLMFVEAAELRGRVEMCRKLIWRLGDKRFGIPHLEYGLDLVAINDLGRLRRIVDRLPDAYGWADLLATR
jgi:hypothetical protein